MIISGKLFTILMYHTIYSLDLLHSWKRFSFIGFLLRAIKLFPLIQKIQIIIYLCNQCL